MRFPNTGGRRGLSGKQLALILRYSEPAAFPLWIYPDWL